MKRWLAVLLAAAMVVLSACGGVEKKETEPDTQKETATLQVDLEAMELTLTDYEGVVYESSFAVIDGMIEVVTGGKLIQISAWGDTAYVMCYPEGSYEEWEEYTFEYQY